MCDLRYLTFAAAVLASACTSSAERGARVRTPQTSTQGLPETLGVAALEQRPWTGPPPVNFSGVYSHGDTLPLLPLLDSARERIDIEIYEMNDRRVLEALRAARDRGVRIRIVKDNNPVGNSCRFDPSSTPAAPARRPANPAEPHVNCGELRAFFRELRESRRGDRWVEFDKSALCGRNPPERAGRRNCFQHGKLALVDQKWALVSSGNFNPSSLCPRSGEAAPRLPNCNRDFTVVTDQVEIVRALSEVFEKDLVGERPDIPGILRKHGVESRLTISPMGRDTLQDLIRSAKIRVQFQNQYLRRDSGLADVLGEVARRGVRVDVQLADVCHYGSVRDRLALEYDLLFRFLEDQRVRLRMFSRLQRVQNRPGYLHAKALVIDEEVLWVGSINGSRTSLDENREFGVVLRDPRLAKALSLRMEMDLSHPSAQLWRESMRCRDRRTPRDSSAEAEEI